MRNTLKHISKVIVRQRNIIILLLLIFSVFTFINLRRAFFSSKQRTVLTVYTAAGVAAANGQDIYEVTNKRNWHFIYPPLFSIFMIPMSKLSLLVAVPLWYVINVLLLLASMALLMKALNIERHKFTLFFLTLCVFNIGAYASTLTNGQVNVFVLFLVSLCYWFFASKRPIMSGLFCALAAAVKVTPILLVVYFAIKKQWKALWGVTVGLALFLFVVPSLVFGWAKNLALLQRFYQVVLVDMSLTGFGEQVRNSDQSLYALIRRIDQFIPALPVDMVWMILGGALMMSAFFVLSKNTKNNTPLKTLFEFSIFTTLILLLSKGSNHGHFCIWLFPHMVLAFYLLIEAPSAEIRKWSKNLLIATITLSLVYYCFNDLRYYSFLFLANLTLFFGLLSGYRRIYGNSV